MVRDFRQLNRSKECSLNFPGKLYLYLGQREFISCDGIIEDIKGVAYIPDQQDNLKGLLPFKNILGDAY